MASTSKTVRFREPEVIEYDVVMITVSWKRAPHSAPGLGEEEMAEFDADCFERQGQRALSKRAHRLLALGRAAELRASVLTYLAQGSRSRLPDIARIGRSSLPQKSSAPRTRRPAPQPRDRNVSVDSHDVCLTPVAHAAQVPGDVDSTVRGTQSQSEPDSKADVSCLDINSFNAGGSTFDCQDGAPAPPLEVLSPVCARTAQSSYLTAWKSDDSTGGNIDNESRRDVKPQADFALQRRSGTLTPQSPSAIGAQAALKDQVPLSPVPPSVGAVRPRPPPHRKFWRDVNQQSSAESGQNFEPVTGVHSEASTPFRQQFPVPDESAFVDFEYAVLSDTDSVGTLQNLPPSASSI
eukprot:TRINITY_DN9205_c0_g1_i2.p1 TRINITY_DN9205_c0_g1~~TRINITY_DN9205_c0_g1_i2.p1  ORF type:complete len:351 (+),score=39.27 TRINITY_DN9205_c0_g1_i2:76-1128(+)